MGHDSELLPPRVTTRDDPSHAPAGKKRGRLGTLLGSIQARLQLSHLLTSMLPLLALGSLLVYTSERSERRTAEQMQVSVARSIASDMDNALAGLSSDLAAFGERAAQPEMRDQLPAAADMLLERHATVIRHLAVLDAEGTEVLRRSAAGDADQLPLRSRAAELGARAALSGETHWGIVRPRRGPPAIQIGVPIMDGPETVSGAVVAEIDTQPFAQRLSSVPLDTGRSAFLIDETGAPLIGQPPRSLAGGDRLRDAWQPEATLATLPTDDGKLVLARAPLGTNWYVVVEQPEAKGLSSGRTSTTLLTVLLVFAGVLVAAWAMVLAREMSGPLLRLRAAARDAGAGAAAGSVPVERADEVGDLALEFNRMLERLSEARVQNEARGRELGAVQRELKQRNDELRDGLALAGAVQHDLLPHTLPPEAPVEAAARADVASEAGGDFYLYVPLPDGRLRVVLGDAAGSGVVAALLIALTSLLVETHARDADGPAELLERVNRLLYPRFSRGGTSVGLLIAELDPRSARLGVANAGMIAPLVAGADGQVYVECFGPPLGIVERPRYEAVSVPLLSGQTVVLVSDGVVEARNAANEMWSFARLEGVVAASLAHGPDAIVEQVLQAVRAYAAPDSQAGDRTIVAVRLKAADHLDDFSPGSDI